MHRQTDALKVRVWGSGEREREREREREKMLDEREIGRGYKGNKSLKMQ